MALANTARVNITYATGEPYLEYTTSFSHGVCVEAKDLPVDEWMHICVVFENSTMATEAKVTSGEENYVGWYFDAGLDKNGSLTPQSYVYQLPGMSASVECPVCPTLTPIGEISQYIDDLETIVIHLNDSHLWSREAIADWLDTLDIDLEFK